jgi:hypothetical protein
MDYYPSSSDNNLTPSHFLTLEQALHILFVIISYFYLSFKIIHTSPDDAKKKNGTYYKTIKL